MKRLKNSNDSRMEVKEFDNVDSNILSTSGGNSNIIEPPSNRFNYYNSESISSLTRSNSLHKSNSNSRGLPRYLSSSSNNSSNSEFFVIQDIVEIETSSTPPTLTQPNILKRTSILDNGIKPMPSNGSSYDVSRKINYQPKVSDLVEVPLKTIIENSPLKPIPQDNNTIIKQTIITNHNQENGQELTPNAVQSSLNAHRLIKNEIVDKLPDKTNVKDYKYEIYKSPIDLNDKNIIKQLHHHHHHHHQKYHIQEPDYTSSEGSPYIPTSLIETSLPINDIAIKSKKEMKRDMKIEKELQEALQQQQNEPSAENKLKRKQEKKKKKKKKKYLHLEHKKNSFGETIYKGHPSWLLMRTIQTGLVNCISKTSTETMNHDTSSNNSQNFADHLFESKKYTLPIIEEHPGFTFTFKDYCPHVFHKLRENFSIDNFSYVYSICQSWNEISTPGKSGSIFFFSSDNQYVLKTIPKREAKLLRELLPEYYEHIKRNPNTLLPKFFGLHRVKPKDGRQVRFLVMKNLFSTNKIITQRFDLKGSTVGRELRPEEAKKKNPTLKDLDFRRMGASIHLGPERKKLFLHQLNEDCKFLVRLNIMDYSLLIGLHKKSDLIYEDENLNMDYSDTSSSCSSDEMDDYNSSEDEYTGNFDSELSKSNDINEGGSGNHRKHQKKLSSVSETQNYLSHVQQLNSKDKSTPQASTLNVNTNNNSSSSPKSSTSDIDSSFEPSNNNNTPISNSTSNLNATTTTSATEDYMKPVDLPTLPPVLKDEPEKDFIPTKPKISVFEHDKGGMKGLDENGDTLGEYYYIGIIDILMLYSLRKQIEHTYKSLFNKGEVSSVDPVEYAARFLNFISENIK